METEGIVYTLRSLKRKNIGYNCYNYYGGDYRRGNVYIEYIGDFGGRSCELEEYVKDSGFSSLTKWLKKAKGSRFLYKVTMKLEVN
ncbi:hypothetical protein LCGC14_2420270 [marine sediment metagenome]|uniref:Uncharacterized protein n=1 Tax=marine sediment metagenome TaxID=412755 RepID=A0A0F9BPZ4_9ZZZZ